MNARWIAYRSKKSFDDIDLDDDEYDGFDMAATTVRRESRSFVLDAYTHTCSPCLHTQGDAPGSPAKHAPIHSRSVVRLVNKEPKWNAEKQYYTMHFHNHRVTEACEANFLMIVADGEEAARGETDKVGVAKSEADLRLQLTDACTALLSPCSGARRTLLQTVRTTRLCSVAAFGGGAFCWRLLGV